MEDLGTRVQQFNSLQLPGQPMGMHMGTSYLVNDLWHEVQRLREELARSAQLQTEADSGGGKKLVRPVRCPNCETVQEQELGRIMQICSKCGHQFDNVMAALF